MTSATAIEDRARVLASDVYPAGVPCWIDIAQGDPEAATGFYGGLFGWDVDDTGRYVVAQLGERERTVAGIRPADDDAPPPAWTTYVCVDDAVQTAGRVVAAGGTIVAPPAVGAGGARVALVADPAGAVLGLWEPRGRRGAQLVNVPGTWNFSTLSTPDPAAAEAFYGAVFGWEARPVRVGGEVAATMLCLPGYGRTQEAKEPGFLRRHAEAGTPEGFTDAFGWLATTPPSASTASWDVTFAVTDATAVARRAAELGGTVEVPPYDAGAARLAVVADPWGARFTVSAYMP